MTALAAAVPNRQTTEPSACDGEVPLAIDPTWHALAAALAARFPGLAITLAYPRRDALGRLCGVRAVAYEAASEIVHWPALDAEIAYRDGTVSADVAVLSAQEWRWRRERFAVTLAPADRPAARPPAAMTMMTSA